MLRFQNVFSPQFNVKPAFSNSSGLKSVFESLHFRSGEHAFVRGQVKTSFPSKPTPQRTNYKQDRVMTTDFIDPIDLYIKIFLFGDQNSTLFLSTVNDGCYKLWNVCHVPGQKQRRYK